MNARMKWKWRGQAPRLALLALLGWAAPAGGQSPPEISLEPQNQGLSIPSRFDAVLAHTTPAYVSLDQPRAVTLLYSSAQAEPRPLVQVDVTPAPGDVPEKLSISLRDASGTRVRLANGSTENFYAAGSGQTQRLAAQLDASALPTGAYAYTAVVRSWQGTRFAEATAPVRVLVVNERESPFGAGWSLAGVQRLHVRVDKSIVLTEGDGSAAYFTYLGCSSGICSYESPPGDFSQLWFQHSDAKYYREYPGGTRAVFGTYGLLKSIVDREGRSITFGYGALDRLERITDPAGLSIELGYDPQGRLATVRDTAGRVTRVETDRSGWVVRITDPDSVPALRMHYDGSRLVQYWDRRGSGYGLDYDGAGQVAASTLPRITTADGEQLRPTTRYDSWAAAVLPEPGRGTFTNPAAQRLPSDLRAEITDPRENVTRLAIDRWNAPTRVEGALGRVSLTERTEHGRVERTVSPAGDTVDYAYDPTGTDLIRVHDHRTGQLVQMGYTPDHRLSAAIGGLQEVLHEFELDPNDPTYRGDLLFSRVGSEAFYFEKLSDQIETVYGPGGARGFHYAASGWRNTESVAGADGSSVAYAYDSAGRVRRIRNALGDSVGFEYDALNRLRHTLDAAGNATTYKYDATDLIRVSDAKGQTYSTLYNALGWVESRTDPLGRTETFGYDASGNLVRHTNRRGQTVAFGYDALDRVRWRDADGERTTYEYDPLGAWIAASNGESTDTVKVEWEAAGSRLVHQKSVREGLPDAYTLTSTYDAQGVRTGVQATSPLGTGYFVAYEYHREDESFRPREIVGPAGGTTSVLFTDSLRLGKIAFPTADTVFARALSVRYSDPVVERALGVAYELDALDRVVQRATNVGAGDSLRAFDYDPVGRLTLREDTLATEEEVCDPEPGIGTCYFQPVRNFLGRASYAYDAVGNRTDHGAQVEGGNRLTVFDGYTLEYDLDGNVLRKYLAADSLAFDQRLHWNSLGQLESVWTRRQGVESTVSYGYDGWDRRVRRATNAGTTRYVYDGSHVALELDGSGNVVAQYSYFPGVDQPHSVKRGGSVYYYLADGPGNVVGLLDASGALVNEYHYSPWGEAEVEREGVAQPYRFTGREWDAEVGLYQYRARWYDPELGRFLSEDPIGLAGGINGYAYAENDPVNHSDPSGLTCLKRATGGQCLLWDLEGISNLPRPVGWQGRIYQRNWLFGALTDLHDPDDEAAYLQQLQQAEADARKRELLGEAIRSTPGFTPTTRNPAPGVFLTGFSDAVETPPWYADLVGWMSGGLAAGAIRLVGARTAAASLWPAASGGEATINGITYTIHALERMQPVGTIIKNGALFSRGVPVSVVENAIANGVKTPGKYGGLVHTFENVRVVTNGVASRVWTVIKLGH